MCAPIATPPPWGIEIIILVGFRGSLEHFFKFQCFTGKSAMIIVAAAFFGQYCAAFLMSHRDWQRDKKQELLGLIGTLVEKFPRSRDVASI